MQFITRTKIHQPSKAHICRKKPKAKSMFGLAGTSRMSRQWLSSVTVSTVPGHLLLSITLPQVQHGECQEPTALTSTHARTVQLHNTDLHIHESWHKEEGGIIERYDCFMAQLITGGDAILNAKQIRSQMFVRLGIIKLIYCFIRGDGSFTGS